MQIPFSLYCILINITNQNLVWFENKSWMELWKLYTTSSLYILWNENGKNTQRPYVHVGNEREMKKKYAIKNLKQRKKNKVKKLEEISIPSRQVQAATSPQIDSFKLFILYTLIFQQQQQWRRRQQPGFAWFLIINIIIRQWEMGACRAIINILCINFT